MYIDREKSKKIKIAAVSVGLIGITAAALTFGGCASCSRFTKTLESDFGDGVYRTVRVYDVNGELISEYAGYFDVTYDDNRIIFDDENDQRHQIFVGTGTVEIDEVSKEEVEKLQQDGNVKVYTKQITE